MLYNPKSIGQWVCGNRFQSNEFPWKSFRNEFWLDLDSSVEAIDGDASAVSEMMAEMFTDFWDLNISGDLLEELSLLAEFASLMKNDGTRSVLYRVSSKVDW